MFSPYPVCRLHGSTCRTPWGYDPEHTDSATPYTLEELAERQESPHRYAYASLREYEAEFRLWRAVGRDAAPSPLERLVACCVTFARIAQAWPHQDHSCPIVQVLADLQDMPDGFTAALDHLCPCQPT